MRYTLTAILVVLMTSCVSWFSTKKKEETKDIILPPQAACTENCIQPAPVVCVKYTADDCKDLENKK